MGDSESSGATPCLGAIDRTRRAKRPVSLLAGPYGHPFHPILVTVPLGTWTASLGFDIASRFADEADVFAKGAYWLIGFGIVGALAAAAFGLLDLFAIPTGTRAFRIGLIHMTLNLSVVGLFAVSFLIRLGDIDAPDETGLVLLVLSVVALGLVGTAGWLGGVLSYRYGVRVAEETTQAEGFINTKGAG